MYLNYYDLNREPFNITPDPEFLYLSPCHKEALASIIYGVEQRKGFIAVLGEIGVGKTTILRSYLNRIDRDKLLAIYILNPMLSFPNLLRLIGRELGVSISSPSTFEMLNQLHEHLIKEFSAGRNIVLIIDEAQNMPVDTLENLRMLSNIETSTHKLIQIVFSAQSEFEKTLNLLELKQLKQRIAVRAVISPLDQATGVSYIRHRLEKAAGKDSVLFTPAALKEIVRVSEGIPRIINIVCDNCLITAYGYNKKNVTMDIVREVARDHGLLKGVFSVKLLAVLAPLLALALIFLYVALWRNSDSNPPAASSTETSLQQKAPEKPGQHPDEAVIYVERVVRKNDTIVKLVKEVYGKVDRHKIANVKKANPDIGDENVIIEGERIIFPINQEAK